MSAGSTRPVLSFGAWAFALTWLVWVPRALSDSGVLAARWAEDLGDVWTYGPALAAVLVATLAGRPALRELGRRLTRWRVAPRWWAVVLLGPAALWAVAAGVHVALGGAATDARPLALEVGPAAVLPLLLLLCLTDGLGEEAGWRGWALPRLLERTGPLTASVVLGLMWAVWHAPLVWTEGATLAGTSVWLLLVQLPALSVVHTWVFLGSGGSALTAVVLHASVNLVAVPLPGPAGAWQAALLQLGLQLAVATALAVHWHRARLDHRAVTVRHSTV